MKLAAASFTSLPKLMVSVFIFGLPNTVSAKKELAMKACSVNFVDCAPVIHSTQLAGFASAPGE